MFWIGSSVFVLDFFHLGSLMSPRLFGRAEVVISVLDFGYITLLFFLCSFARRGLVVLSLGLACLDSVFAPPVLDSAHIGLPLLFQSFAHLRFLSLIPDLVSNLRS